MLTSTSGHPRDKQKKGWPTWNPNKFVVRGAIKGLSGALALALGWNIKEGWEMMIISLEGGKRKEKEKRQCMGGRWMEMWSMRMIGK